MSAAARKSDKCMRERCVCPGLRPADKEVWQIAPVLLEPTHECI